MSNLVKTLEVDNYGEKGSSVGQKKTGFSLKWGGQIRIC